MDIGITTKKAPQLDSSIDTMVNLIDLIDQPQGVHKTKTTLFSIPLAKLRELQSLALESTNYDYESAEYRVTAKCITNVMHLASTLLTFPSCQAIFHQHQPMVSMHLSSFAMPVVAQVILIF